MLFLLELADVVAKNGWRCLTFCLMSTHYHFLVQTPETNLANGMWRLNGRYAASFNRRHQAQGHVFAARYWAEPVTRDAHLLEALRYIALNPVRAGIVDRPELWRWGAHRFLLDSTASLGWLAIDDTLSWFGSARGGRSRDRYASFVGDGLPTARTTARSRRA